jgi:hypothetical protein
LVFTSLNDVENRIETLLHPVDEVALAGSIGPDFLNSPASLLPAPLEKQPGPITILNVGSVNDHVEHIPDCIDDHMALAITWRLRPQMSLPAS